MNKQHPALNLKTITMFASIIGLFLLFTTWAWWNSKGPFKNKPSHPPVERINLLENVEYIDPYISFERFAEFRGSQQFVEGKGGVPVLRSYKRVGGKALPTTKLVPPPPEETQGASGESILSLPPFLRNTYMGMNSVRTTREMSEMLKIEQDFTNCVTSVVTAFGLRPPPFLSSQQQTVNSMSFATMNSIIRTYKAEHIIYFQIKTSIQGQVRVAITKPMLLQMELGSASTPLYTSEERYAVLAIKEALRRNALEALINTNKGIFPLDKQQPLRSNPEGDPVNIKSIDARTLWHAPEIQK